MPIFDTHTHIFSSQFSEDISQVVSRAQSAGVSKMLLPNIDKDSVDSMLALCNDYPTLCFPAIGLHPTSVDKQFEKQLDFFETLLAENQHRFIAIGETGLDLYWDKTFLAQQIEALTIQIQWAKKYRLPIVLHVREAFDEIFEVIDRLHDENLTGIFHCFTGNQAQAQHILQYQTFKIGIGGVVTFKNSGLAQVLTRINLSNIVVETDAPYLAPAPYRGKRNEPAYITKVIDKLSEIYQLPADEIANITFNNALEIFNIS